MVASRLRDKSKSFAAGSAQIIVGTPGRVLDHLARGTLVLGDVTTLVLDEAIGCSISVFVPISKRFLLARRNRGKRCC